MFIAIDCRDEDVAADIEAALLAAGLGNLLRPVPEAQLVVTDRSSGGGALAPTETGGSGGGGLAPAGLASGSRGSVRYLRLGVDFLWPQQRLELVRALTEWSNSAGNNPVVVVGRVGAGVKSRADTELVWHLAREVPGLVVLDLSDETFGWEHAELAETARPELAGREPANFETARPATAPLRLSRRGNAAAETTRPATAPMPLPGLGHVLATDWSQVDTTGFPALARLPQTSLAVLSTRQHPPPPWDGELTHWIQQLRRSRPVLVNYGTVTPALVAQAVALQTPWPAAPTAAHWALCAGNDAVTGQILTAVLARLLDTNCQSVLVQARRRHYFPTAPSLSYHRRGSLHTHLRHLLTQKRG
ncbi:MAG: hypothetical protein Q4P06_05680 [Actinomycetaceae bacterium]|nr:hypothetical protein [Actinomycetaceae bacterium]